jgi:hypothetical protein
MVAALIAKLVFPLRIRYLLGSTLHVASSDSSAVTTFLGTFPPTWQMWSFSMISPLPIPPWTGSKSLPRWCAGRHLSCILFRRLLSLGLSFSFYCPLIVAVHLLAITYYELKLPWLDAKTVLIWLHTLFCASWLELREVVHTTDQHLMVETTLLRGFSPFQQWYLLAFPCLVVHISMVAAPWRLENIATYQPPHSLTFWKQSF